MAEQNNNATALPLLNNMFPLISGALFVSGIEYVKNLEEGNLKGGEVLLRLIIFLYTIMVTIQDHYQLNDKFGNIYKKWKDVFILVQVLIIFSLSLMGYFSFSKTLRPWLFSCSFYFFLCIFWNLTTNFKGNKAYSVIAFIDAYIVFLMAYFYECIKRFTLFDVYFGDWLFIVGFIIFSIFQRLIWVYIHPEKKLISE